MTLIKTIDPKEATGKVAAIYDHFISKFGMVPNAFKVTSSSEFLLSQQATFLGYYMEHPSLSFKLQAFIRMLVSVNHDCEYCIKMNTGMLLQSGVSMEDIQATKANPEQAPIEGKDVALLLFVLKVVSNSNSITKEDLDKLRKLGWQDSEILEATFHGTSQISSDMIFNAFKIENDKI
jgi:alkylhydroperoxidase family enzyme